MQTTNALRKEPFLIRLLAHDKYRAVRYIMLVSLLTLVSANELRCRYDLSTMLSAQTAILFFNQFLFKLLAFLLAIKVFVPRLFLTGRTTTFSVLIFSTLALSIKLQWLAEWLVCEHFDYPYFRGNAPIASLVIDVVIQNTQWILFTSGLLALYMLRFFIAENVRERQIADEKMRLETELLKRQVSPKLLLATLHKLGTEGAENPQQASESIITLCQLLRYRLYESRRPMSLLESELRFLRQYLELMQYSGECQSFSIDVEGSTLGVFVPPLLFIPLFTYDDGNAAPAHIDVKVQLASELHLSTNAASRSSLSSIGERLEAVCPGQYSIGWSESETHVTLKL